MWGGGPLLFSVCDAFCVREVRSPYYLPFICKVASGLWVIITKKKQKHFFSFSFFRFTFSLHGCTTRVLEHPIFFPKKKKNNFSFFGHWVCSRSRGASFFFLPVSSTSMSLVHDKQLCFSLWVLSVHVTHIHLTSVSFSRSLSVCLSLSLLPFSLSICC